MKNAQTKIKSIKTGKKIGTTFCLGCKDYINNSKPQKMKMTSKVLKKNQTVLFVGLVSQYF